MKKPRKSRRKLRWLLLISPVITIILVLLLFYKPSGYVPSDIASKRQVTEYVTHVLGQGVYNYAQRQQPFDLVIPQERTEDIIDLSKWPRASDGIRFARPKVFFLPEKIMLMGTVNIRGVDIVVTVTAKPILDPQGLLTLHLAKVKVGAMNITPLAKAIAAQIHQSSLDQPNADRDAWQIKIMASLLNDQPFDPVFPIEDKKLRIKKITLTNEKLTIRFFPAPD